MDRCIFHVDVNSAFLSWSAVKRLKEDPSAVDLRTIPSAVGGDVRTRHGVITAKSLPAKKFGIHTGEAVVSALGKCPSLTLIPSDFATYRQYSKAFIRILESHAPLVEQVSIDEAYLDMTEIVHTTAGLLPTSTEHTAPEFSASEHPAPAHADVLLRETAVRLARTIKDEIRESLGFTVNIGIASNKLLAKMASDFEKPDKLHTLWEEEIPAKLWPLPIGALHGCGRSSASALSAFGIKTIGDAARSDIQILRAILGEKGGDYISRCARGHSRSPVRSTRDAAKSYSNERTTPEDISEENYRFLLPPLLKGLSVRVAERMQRDAIRALTIGVMVKTGKFQRHSRQTTLPSSTSDSKKIFDTATTLMEALLLSRQGLFRKGEVLRLVGISAQNLDSGHYEQLSLFDFTPDTPAHKSTISRDIRKSAPQTDTENVSPPPSSPPSTMDSESCRTSAKNDAGKAARLDAMIKQLNIRYGPGTVHRGDSQLSTADSPGYSSASPSATAPAANIASPKHRKV